ncbi:MAG: radical SAM protein [Clostridium sp.]|nr:radical SAM protein [Clostridium sp.]
MEFNNVAILLTENCNARCEMCCDSRGHVVGKTLDIDEIDLILQNIYDIRFINHISITGGEPMLYKDRIEYILNYKFDRKVNISLKTNGFWGKDYSKAKKFISKYAKKISKISQSVDKPTNKLGLSILFLCLF